MSSRSICIFLKNVPKNLLILWFKTIISIHIPQLNLSSKISHSLIAIDKVWVKFKNVFLKNVKIMHYLQKYKKDAVENFAKFTEKTWTTQALGLRLYLKVTPAAQVFSYEFCKNLKDNFLKITPPVTAMTKSFLSVIMKGKTLIFFFSISRSCDSLLLLKTGTYMNSEKSFR